jgi:pimeloyl-ACP methyl ester carboxylesterase
MEQLLSALELGDIDWIGTSLGGLVGMTLAARPAAHIRRLVLNDVGPWVPGAALVRIGEHLGRDPSFADLDDAEAYLRRVRSGSGPLTDDQWRRMTTRTVRPAPEGGYRLHYDPSLALRYRDTSLRDLDAWETWDAVTCPVLVLRGGESDFLLAETTREMESRGPGAKVVEVESCGHAPPLMQAAQFAPILDWLGPPGKTEPAVRLSVSRER